MCAVPCLHCLCCLRRLCGVSVSQVCLWGAVSEMRSVQLCNTGDHPPSLSKYWPRILCAFLATLLTPSLTFRSTSTLGGGVAAQMRHQQASGYWTPYFWLSVAH